MKNGQLLALSDALKELKGLKLPSKATFAIIKSTAKIDSAVKHFKEAHTQLLTDFSTVEGEVKFKEVDGKKFYDIQNMEEYNKQYVELLDADADVTLHTFEESILEGYDCTPEQGIILMEFFQKEN